MRTYAEEKRSGTIELLLTSPITDLQIVLGKFLGAVGMYAGLLAVTMLYIVILFAFGRPDWRPIVTGISVSSCWGRRSCRSGCSSPAPRRTRWSRPRRRSSRRCHVDHRLVRRQRRRWLGDLLTYLSITTHMEDFSKGIIDTKHVVFYLSFIAFGLLHHAEVDGRRAVEGLIVKKLVGLLGWIGVVLVVAAVGLRFFAKPAWLGWAPQWSQYYWRSPASSSPRSTA